MKRRDFMKAGAVGATAGLVSAPSVVRAQESFAWKMTNAYGPGAPMTTVGPGSPTRFAELVAGMSKGRLTFQHFAAGELIPAFEGFDAVVAGTVEANAANSYFWSGRSFAAQYFTNVPFGMSFPGHMAWLYHGGGMQLWEEVYQPFGLVAFPFNNTGTQMTGWFRKELGTVEDLKGMKMRIPGLSGKVYAALGVDVRLLSGPEIFPALERGVIDAAEFVGPYSDRRLGLHKAAKNYYTTGWHEPNNAGELLINKAMWDSLPDDLKTMVRTAAMTCLLESYTWCESVNGEALVDLVENEGVTARPLPTAIVDRLREATADTLETEAAKDPLVRKVHDHYMAFKAKHDRWTGIARIA
ncbi:TRAP transporter substrate-binding protein DctP (plasmid) [Skermanella mucosa]|uniref:TRAP transporter substrate-binding protein n=1 Tax=Skermanella mucosa TaxID=1789672 RepID=UPI00192BA82E|nr:TRAP transporter substrate-binding protein DctP [Skermanella mucosa]UEM24683.1 TRAP transporter substrate-binding protein DctP [Skermanella mucosa]